MGQKIGKIYFPNTLLSNVGNGADKDKQGKKQPKEIKAIAKGGRDVENSS